MNGEKRNEHSFGFFKVLGGIIVGVVVAGVFAFVIGALIMVLWNWLMPEIFELGTITYWQGFGIALLARLLFGGMGHTGECDKHSPKSRIKHSEHMHRFSLRTGRLDDMYEDWWEDEGSKSFDAYMKRDKNKEQTDKEDK